MKTCPRCEVLKPLTDFPRDASKKSGRSSHCDVCKGATRARWGAANKERLQEYSRRWCRENPEAVHAANAKNRLILKQKREAAIGAAVRCALCGIATDKLNWDHDHGTGNPRGWLCGSCNTSLGKFGDNPVLLDRAANYLRTHGFTATKSVLR